jgi:hypothetical protein
LLTVKNFCDVTFKPQKSLNLQFPRPLEMVEYNTFIFQSGPLANRSKLVAKLAAETTFPLQCIAHFRKIKIDLFPS